MSDKAWDVIVVGARCAGSPTAMLLARAGYRVSGRRSGHVPERHDLDPCGAPAPGSPRCGAGDCSTG